MVLGSFFREAWIKLGSTPTVSARIIPTWQAGRPLPAPDDYDAFINEGYAANPLVAACIWEIGTSASEPHLVVKRRAKDGSLDVADGFDADELRALLSKPNPEQTTYTFLEQCFTFQQITGNWFVRKIRAQVGRGIVYLWPLHPQHVKIIPSVLGWVAGYRYTGVKDFISAEDVIHDPLHPNPNDTFWGLSPISVLRRSIDLDNQAIEYLRVYFQNHAVPGGLLKLKARMEPSERQRLKELWTKEHSGSAGWHSVSVLDADGEYQEIGNSPEKLRLQAIWDQTESRICMAFGVPPILVGVTVGLNRSTFANYLEARKSFWQETLTPLYQRAGQRLTEGVAKEFAPDLVVEFDLSKVEALSESAAGKRQFAMDAYDRGFLTLNQALEMMGMPTVSDEEGGGKRKAQAAPESGLLGLLGEAQHRLAHEQHRRTLTSVEKKAQARLLSVMHAHFKGQKEELLKHLDA